MKWSDYTDDDDHDHDNNNNNNDDDDDNNNNNSNNDDDDSSNNNNNDETEEEEEEEENNVNDNNSGDDNGEDTDHDDDYDDDDDHDDDYDDDHDDDYDDDDDDDYDDDHDDDSSSVRNLGVTFDQSLCQHVANVCRLCYLEIRHISSVRHLLSDDATKTLLCAFVLSRLDYCNALLAGSPKHLIEKLQKVQNHVARLVFRCSKFDHVTPLLHSLHWLPVHLRIDYKISSLCFKVLESTAPSYLSDLLHVYTPPPPPHPPPPTPGNFVLHLMIDFSVFLTSEQSRMVNALLLIRELTPGTSSHSPFGIHSL